LVELQKANFGDANYCIILILATDELEILGNVDDRHLSAWLKCVFRKIIIICWHTKLQLCL